jgi:hypothetical protein
MRWPQIDLGAQDLNDIQQPKSLKKIAGSKEVKFLIGTTAPT